MTWDLATLLEPGRSALVVQECQNGVIGAQAVFPALAEVVRDTGLVTNVARLATAARAGGVPVLHCLATRRSDGLGSNVNARIYGAAARSPVLLEPGSEAAAVVPEIGVAPGDLVLERLHGVGPMHGTELDPILRNLGISTVVAVGVSLNVGVLDLVLDAVNAGYQVVLPRDAVAGVPPEYGQAVIEHSLSLLASVTTTDHIAAAWGSERPG